MFSNRFPNRYFSLPELTCFDGDDDAATAAAAKAAADAAAAAAGDKKTFTQADLDRIVQERLSRDRKAREETQREAVQELENKYKDLLSNQNLTQEDRDKLQTKLDDVSKQLRTKDEQAAHDKKQLQAQYEQQLAAETKARETWENRFRESTISSAIQDAAVKHEAWDNAQLEAILRPMAKLSPITDLVTGQETGRFQTLIDFVSVNEKGEEAPIQGTPQDIVKRMKEIDRYKNLFKANVAPGIGANSATGGQTPGSNGRIDVRKLTPQQYAKIRKENPALLGL